MITITITITIMITITIPIMMMITIMMEMIMMKMMMKMMMEMMVIMTIIPSSDLDVVGDTVEQLICTNLLPLFDDERSSFVTFDRTSSFGSMLIIASHLLAIS